MKKGLLLRVAADSQSCGWNAPCRQDGRFCYVPILDRLGRPERGPAFRHGYDEFRPFVAALGAAWPPHLDGPCHLDPDFAHLTYGDLRARGARLRRSLGPGDFIAFWAGLRWLDGPSAGELVCALIGYYEVAEIVEAAAVPPWAAHRNAHARHLAAPGEVVVFADPARSGRLRRHLPIGGARRRTGSTRPSQRVGADLLAAWGGLGGADGRPLLDGYIQQSGSPPFFTRPDRFLEWFHAQAPGLVHANNV